MASFSILVKLFIMLATFGMSAVDWSTHQASLQYHYHYNHMGLGHILQCVIAKPYRSRACQIYQKLRTSIQ